MPITDLSVSINPTDESNLQSQDFRMVNVNLNKRGGGNAIYLWYKQDSGSGAITRVQVSFSNEMSVGLRKAGYIQIDRDLNAGSTRGPVYLWYFRGSGKHHTPIVEIDVTTEAANEAGKFDFGWERVACDLNRGATGDWIHIWLKRENPTYICDVAATDSYGSDTDYLKGGYIRVDEDTNRGAPGGGKPVFIWFRQTTDSQGAVNDLKVSTNKTDYLAYQQQQYSSVNINLNEGSSGDKVTLWFKKGSYNPIQAITLLLNKALIENYRKAGLTVIEEDLNTGNGGWLEYLCYYNK
ncbi:uncharacterized protein LOC144466559 [Epinephelus lanceolatus]